MATYTRTCGLSYSYHDKSSISYMATTKPIISVEDSNDMDSTASPHSLDEVDSGTIKGVDNPIILQGMARLIQPRGISNLPCLELSMDWARLDNGCFSWASKIK